MDWTTVEDALHAWIVAATGLAATNVFWEQQGIGKPAGAYVTMNLSITQSGQDWTDITDNPTPSPGAEIIHTVRGPRLGTLALQCFAGDATGPSSSKAYLAKLHGSLGLPSIHDALVIAKVGIAIIDPVQSLTLELGNAVIESRALTSIKMHLTSEVSETGTYIETAQHSGVATTPGGAMIKVPLGSFSSAFSEAFS